MTEEKQEKITYRRAITSPSIVKLHRAYKAYIVDSIIHTEPIIPLEKFYQLKVREKEISRSRNYEKYLLLLSQKQSKTKK